MGIGAKLYFSHPAEQLNRMGSGPSRYEDISDVDLTRFSFLKQLTKDDIARFFSDVVRPCSGRDVAWRDYFSFFRSLHEKRAEAQLQRHRRTFHPACSGFAMIRTGEPLQYEQVPEPPEPEPPPLVPDNFTEPSDAGSNADEDDGSPEGGDREGERVSDEKVGSKQREHNAADASEQPVRVRVAGWDPERVSPMFFGYLHTTAAEHDQKQAELRRQAEHAELQAIHTALATREAKLQELITQHRQRSAIRDEKLKKLAEAYELSRKRAKDAYGQSLRMLSGSQAEMLKRKYVALPKSVLSHAHCRRSSEHGAHTRTGMHRRRRRPRKRS